MATLYLPVSLILPSEKAPERPPLLLLLWPAQAAAGMKQKKRDKLLSFKCIITIQTTIHSLSAWPLSFQFEKKKEKNASRKFRQLLEEEVLPFAQRYAILPLKSLKSDRTEVDRSAAERAGLGHGRPGLLHQS